MVTIDDVTPKGWLGERLKNISNVKKRRWNIYLRACKKIPKFSPVYGSTSFKKINKRRHNLISKDFLLGLNPEERVEYEALQTVAGTVFIGPTIARNFILARLERRLKFWLGKTESL